MFSAMHDGQMKKRKENGASNDCPAANFRFFGDQFLLDTVSGNFYRVTPTAGFILLALIEGKDDEELASIVQERFGIDRPRALRDIEMFRSELQSLGVIENAR